MPTVLKIKGYRFYFFSLDEKGSAHVHIDREEGTAKVWLESEIKEKYFLYFKAQEKKIAMELVHENYDYLIEKWYECFQK